ncbi:biotin--[acetyl-CoA-carboxylase] ligase [uncultured Winogradskyella sp.]|uniref:biotin--[acetyl-CoA-carboxylase] ligase n=1 Tax=uncultured Winogradskyella sp. TaxID=395353 RepID=UPI0030D7996C|tara:strand:+ start:14135 stop:14863 length:729 start_codon:yes stop_codon:yes gene_type:complete
MYIIKLNAIDSTNAYLKDMISAVLPKDFTVVIADNQTGGRGQMGTIWQTETGKNLTASVFKLIPKLKVEDQFYISMAVSVAIYKSLETFKIPQLSVKWPNDILSADKKLCGTLIENVIKSNKFEGSIIGFGLNINQKYFENLPKASSMSLIAGQLFDKNEVFLEILKQLKIQLNLLTTEKFAQIKDQYETSLFRKDKPSTFKTKGKMFSGIIKGVTNTGQLNVWTEDAIIKTFNLKEVTLLY